jgi:hypothetical protein
VTSRSRESRLSHTAQPVLDQPAEGVRLRVVADAPHRHLETLAREVEAIPPLRARIVQTNRTGPAFLRATNPAAGHLSEDIGCRIEQVSGEHWYFWSWSDGHSDTIGPVDEPADVARAIARVLTPEPGRV